jgi:hypothetical protein
MIHLLHDAGGAVHPDRYRLAWRHGMIAVTGGTYNFAWRFDTEQEAREIVGRYLQRPRAQTRRLTNGGAL